MIYRHLAGKGLDCVVVAPSMIPKRSGDRVKTDRRDAQMLARLHRAGELAAVYVPHPEDEAVRDLTRSREDAKEAQTRARHQLKAFLLRSGVRYAGKTDVSISIARSSGTGSISRESWTDSRRTTTRTAFIDPSTGPRRRNVRARPRPRPPSSLPTGESNTVAGCSRHRLPLD